MLPNFRRMKTFWTIILIIVGSFGVGVLGFNYIAMPLWVGLHEETSVPDVCGKTLEDAQKTLAKFELKTQTMAQKFSNLPEGLVVSQNPLPARRVKKGRVVELCISKGKEKVRVPWVQGLLESQATNLLESSGLEIGELEYKYSTTVSEGRVIYTIPPSDLLVPKGSKVDIFVSKRGKETIMPDLTGKSLKEAKEEANKLGLNLYIRYTGKPSFLGAVILLQSPPAGTPINPGDSLHLIVGPTIPKE